MQVSDVQLLYDYNEWATERILAQAAQVTPEQWIAPATGSLGGLRATLVHMLDTEIGWRTIVQYDRVTDDLVEAEFPSVDALAARWAQDRVEMRAYLDSLTDADVNGTVRYHVNGELRERVLWHVLLHVLNHSMQHRSEAAALLTDLGHSPGDLDLIFYIYRWRTEEQKG